LAPSTIAVMRLTALVLNQTINATSSAKPKPCRPRRHVQRHLREGVVQNRAAGRDIGVGQDIEHKGDRKPFTSSSLYPADLW
jgi:hypothetical protein